MHRFAVAATVLLYLLIADRATAEVVVKVYKSSQRMAVIVDGEHRHTWPVSTGVPDTPVGTYRPQILSRNHRSRLYDLAPMPFAIFYSGDYAIHGTMHIDKIGVPDSAGCVRLHPSNAALLFDLAQKVGPAKFTIHILENEVEPDTKPQVAASTALPPSRCSANGTTCVAP
jgi:hypothetical protein